MITISNIKPYANNAKKHPKSQLLALAKIVKEVGWRQPVLVNQKGVIVAGHGRWATYQQYKDEFALKDIWIIDDKGQNINGQAETKELTEEQANAYRFADNKLNESDWDMKLALPDLKLLSPELFDLTGFDKDLLIEPEAKDDVIPENVPARSKLGDLYELGSHRLLCGDSTQPEAVSRLMDGKKADMVFTDPPYGIDYSGGRTQVVATKTYGKLKNDNLQDEELGNLISQVFSFSKNQADTYICVSPIMQTPFLKFIENNKKKVDAVIVWDKKNAGLGYMAYRRQTEFILFIKGGVFKKGDKTDFDLWSIGKDNTSNYLHGTQKPVALSSRAIINSSKEEDIILDLFLGSGSTLIACEKTNRICHGMELDPKYVDVIVQRYVDYVDNPVITCNGKDVTKLWQKDKKSKN